MKQEVEKILDAIDERAVELASSCDAKTEAENKILFLFCKKLEECLKEMPTTKNKMSLSEVKKEIKRLEFLDAHNSLDSVRDNIRFQMDKIEDENKLLHQCRKPIEKLMESLK